MATQPDKMSDAEIRQHLSGVQYPATKDDLFDYAEEQGAPDDFLTALEQLEDQEFESPTDVARAMGMGE